MIIRVLGSIIGIIGFSVISGVPKKFLIHCSITGAAGWFVYLVSKAINNNEVFSMFLAALAVSLLSHIFARVLKAPVTIFLIPGILPLVPGIGMVRSVYYNINHNSIMTGYNLSLTIQTAGAIAMAILIMDTCFRMYRVNKRK